MKFKISREGGNDHINYFFSNLTEYLDYLEGQSISKIFKNHKLSSVTGNFSFTGTGSYDEAMRLCREGEYSDAFDKFDKERIKFESVLEQRRKRQKIVSDIAGFTPNVPKYLQGHPQNMFNTQRSVQTQKPIIKLYYNFSANAFVSKEQLYARGIFTLALIKELEQNNFAVELNVFELTSCDNQYLSTVIRLKDANAPINYRAVFFPFANPSFLRRIYFRFTEIEPHLTEDWVFGYGRACDLSEVKEYYKINDNIMRFVIGKPDELGLTGEITEKEYEKFIKEIGIKSILESIENKDNGNNGRSD